LPAGVCAFAFISQGTIVILECMIHFEFIVFLPLCANAYLHVCMWLLGSTIRHSSRSISTFDPFSWHRDTELQHCL